MKDSKLKTFFAATGIVLTCVCGFLGTTYLVPDWREAIYGTTTQQELEQETNTNTNTETDNTNTNTKE